MPMTTQDHEEQSYSAQMDQATSTPPTMGEGCELPLIFDIGAAVICTDRRCGRLIRVVMDPATERVTALIVERGGLQKASWVLPVANVQATSEGTVQIGISSDEFGRFRSYKEIEFRVPSVGWNNGRYGPDDVRYWMSPYEGIGGQSVVPSRKHRLHEGVPFDFQVIGNGTKVRDVEGNAGEVDHVLVDCEGGYITHIVIRHGLINGYTIVPVSMIAGVDDQGVVLNVQRAELRALPKYRPEV